MGVPISQRDIFSGTPILSKLHNVRSIWGYFFGDVPNTFQISDDKSFLLILFIARNKSLGDLYISIFCDQLIVFSIVLQYAVLLHFQV